MKTTWIYLIGTAVAITLVNWVASSNVRAAIDRAGDNYTAGFQDGVRAAAVAYEQAHERGLRTDAFERINKRISERALEGGAIEHRTHPSPRLLPPVLEEAPAWETFESPQPEIKEPKPKKQEERSGTAVTVPVTKRTA